MNTWEITMSCVICGKQRMRNTDKKQSEVFDAINEIVFKKELFCDRCNKITEHNFLCIGIQGAI